ncbi:histidine kinase [Paenibacillus periandrae]|uniref:histidine kinase n=1 Tax=Paenibacillus periandrae TaxID=1761741 RepID=UPI001F098525|nr:histidine kinase [Paenibacillus periandrae]
MIWLKRSLFAKLLVGMLVSAIIPYSLSNIISYNTTSNSMADQVIELNQNLMNINMENVKRYFHDLNRVSVSFYQDQTLMHYLRSTRVLPIEILYINNQVDNLYRNRPEFRAVRYISSLNEQKYTSTNVGLTVQTSNILIPKSEEENWDEYGKYEVEILGKEKVLVLNKLLVDYPGPKVLGLLSIHVGLDEIGILIRSHSKPSTGDRVFLYIHKELKLLYTSGEGEELRKGEGTSESNLLGNQGSYKGKLDGREGVFIYVRDQYMDLSLTMVKFVPTAAINESADRTLNQSLFIQFIAIAFVIILASVLSYLTISPVKRLLRSIARVETGNFHVNLTTGRNDELGVLEVRFQTMIQNLDDLMNREYRNRIELTTAQLKMLQAQINPHFLYNSLQSIGTLALRHGSQEINDKIAELGAILRYTMDLKTETVTLQMEIKHIEHYMSLQTGRFKNRLSYTLSCPNEAFQVLVPKMILQPLIENSIVHGFEKGRGSGTLHISMELDQVLCIRIIDNGKGMDPETIERIYREYSDFQLQSGQEGGIGLINVLQRLRLYYGQEFDWEIQSVPYEMTVISLRISIDCLTREGKEIEDIDS